MTRGKNGFSLLLPRLIRHKKEKAKEPDEADRIYRGSRMSICILIFWSGLLARWRPRGIVTGDMTDESGRKLVTRIAGYLTCGRSD
jgi:hypothetical protein